MTAKYSRWSAICLAQRSHGTSTDAISWRISLGSTVSSRGQLCLSEVGILGGCRPSDNGWSVAKDAGPTLLNYHTIAAIVWPAVIDSCVCVVCTGYQARRPLRLDGAVRMRRSHRLSAREFGCWRYRARCWGHRLVVGTTGRPQTTMLSQRPSSGVVGSQARFTQGAIGGYQWPLSLFLCRL